METVIGEFWFVCQFKLNKIIQLFRFSDKWQPQKIEKTLNEYLASLSITPKPSETIKTEAATTTALTIVDINVNTIFNESHQQTTKELKSLIKDKLKMINVK